MTSSTIGVDVGSAVAVGPNESAVSGVSWGAIAAGAVVATAMTLILLLLGSGIGLASVSPWPNEGASAAAFGVGAAIWLVVVQWVSAGLGGYIAGRLRTKWVGVKTDEVFFRDTAHGFATWAASTIIVAAFLIFSASGFLRTATEATATVAAGAASAVGEAAGNADLDPMAYFTDTLFRTPTGASAEGADARAEALRILARGVVADEFPADDRTYLAQVVAAQTGLSPADAEARVDAVIANAQAAEADIRQAADDAADAAAAVAFYAFLSMLIGAFIASVAAAIGGRQRDDVERLIER